MPVAGQKVTIPSGKAITLDITPPALGGLTIEGELIIKDQDGSLTTPNIWVSTIGKLSVGTEDAPFASKFSFVLTGDRASTGLVIGN